MAYLKWSRSLKAAPCACCERAALRSVRSRLLSRSNLAHGRRSFGAVRGDKCRHSAQCQRPERSTDQRMIIAPAQHQSDCKGCKYDSALSTGAAACPFTALYWDFLMRHELLLKKNPRMAMQLKNLSRLDATARDAISAQAVAYRLAQR